VNQIEKLLQTQQGVAQVADEVLQLSVSLQAFHSLPEYEGRQRELQEYRARVETLASPQLEEVEKANNNETTNKLQTTPTNESNDNHSPSQKKDKLTKQKTYQVVRSRDEAALASMVQIFSKIDRLAHLKQVTLFFVIGLSLSLSLSLSLYYNILYIIYIFF